MDRYLAFLRAVNVGGRSVSMAELRRVMADAGYRNVGTYIQSGNVFFDAQPPVDAHALEACLEAASGFNIPVLLRTLEEVEAIIEADPFRDQLARPDQRWVVTFVDRAIPRESLLDGPTTQVLAVMGRDVLSVVTLLDGKLKGYGAVDDRKHGVISTSRFYPTLVKILAAAKSHG